MDVRFEEAEASILIAGFKYEVLFARIDFNSKMKFDMHSYGYDVFPYVDSQFVYLG